MVSEFNLIDRIHLKRPLYRLRKQLQRISSRKFFGFRGMRNIVRLSTPCMRRGTGIDRKIFGTTLLPCGEVASSRGSKGLLAGAKQAGYRRFLPRFSGFSEFLASPRSWPRDPLWLPCRDLRMRADLKHWLADWIPPHLRRALSRSFRQRRRELLGEFCDVGNKLGVTLTAMTHPPSSSACSKRSSKWREARQPTNATRCCSTKLNTPTRYSWDCCGPRCRTAAR